MVFWAADYEFEINFLISPWAHNALPKGLTKMLQLFSSISKQASGQTQRNQAATDQ